MPLSILDHLQTGPTSSKELQVATGLSQASVSRQLASLGSSIVKLGGGRTTRYALTRNAFGAGDRFPVYATDRHGNAVSVACMRPLAHGGYFVEQTIGTPAVLLGERGDGVFEDLPFFLEDLRPQGFLGRQIAQTLAEKSAFPADPRRWSAEQIGSYLVANGDNLPGNLMLGDQNYIRLANRLAPTNQADYPALAESVLGGENPGASAGGEQPKFTTYTEDQGHVIVKFSPPGDDPVSARWRDILLTEFHAANVLRNTLYPAADTKLYEIGDRLFLEAQRFDRHGERGRMPMISLLAIDLEFTGLGSGWRQVMASLADSGLVSTEHVIDAEVLYWFGRYINNTDMHLGNLSLAFDDDVFRLLPVYDMCSMGFAPRSGEVMPYSFSPPDQETDDDAAQNAAIPLARAFWAQLAEDDRISDDLKGFFSRGDPI